MIPNLFPHLPTELNETIYLMAVVAATCAVPGVFLVLRKLVLVGDAISHVLLLGIVLMYLLVQDAASVWLLVGAAATGVATVALVEWLQRTKLVKEDAAIGLVFPALFSIGTLLASMYLRNTHLDVDRVLLGSAELAFQDRLHWNSWDLGPRSLFVVGIAGLAISTLVAIFYKELKLSTFDPGLAVVLGFSPAILQYGLMTCVSVTTVAAFDAVGPVLVLAFFAVPAATARMLTDRLSWLLVWSVVVAVFSAVVGTLIAIQYDTTIAGTVAAILGVVFAIVWLFVPKRGALAMAYRRWKLLRQFELTLLLVHIHRHAGTEEESDESGVSSIYLHLHWLKSKFERVARRGVEKGFFRQVGDIWTLTDAGRERASRLPEFSETNQE
jgi:manganese/zinc/iron transport system permease protein